MKFGIDAKQYFTGPVSTKIILQNVVPLLIDLYQEHDWVIFFDKKDKHRGNPFPYKNVSIQYVWTPTNMLSNLLVMPQSIKRSGVDVTLFQMVLPLVKRSRSVVFIHDVLFKDFPEYFTWKERWYFKPISWTANADRIICTTDYVAKTLVAHKYTRNTKKIDIVPLAVSHIFQPLSKHDPKLVSAVKEKFKLPERFLLFVGRLNARKNIELLIRSLPAIKDKDIKIVIVGKENWKSPDFQNLLADKHVAERIIFTGGMRDEELKVTFAMATIFCFPSFAEGFGLPPLEAMASGVPVIVSSTTAMPEVCGHAALYVNPNNINDMVNAIDKLLEDENLYNEKKIAGLQRASMFTWEQTAHNILKSLLSAQKSNAVD